MRGMFSRILPLMVCLVLFSSQVFAMGGYKDLLWIDAGGQVLHVIADGSTTLTSFLRYREVRYEKNTRKPGHFICTQDGVNKQIPVREIRSVKLQIPATEFAGYPYPDRLERVILTMKDGESFEAQVERNMVYALCNDEYLEMKYWDPVTEQFSFGGFNGDSVREIRFK